MLVWPTLLIKLLKKLTGLTLNLCLVEALTRFGIIFFFSLEVVSSMTVLFYFMCRYSPLHNVRMPEQGQYPALLLNVADSNDRVVPLHSLKYISEVQHTVGRHHMQVLRMN